MDVTKISLITNHQEHLCIFIKDTVESRLVLHQMKRPGCNFLLMDGSPVRLRKLW